MIPIRNILALATTALAFSPAPQAAPVYDVYAIQYCVVRDFAVSLLVAGADTARRIDLSSMVWLLKGTAGRQVLVDAGFHRADLLQRWQPVGFALPSDAVRRVGIQPEDITDVIISHVHFDHIGGIDLFPRARFWIQREEYEHHVDSAGNSLDRAISRADAALLAGMMRVGRVRLVDGDAREIIPGITVYTGGRHTFASQYVGARTPAGVVVIASDDLHVYENLETHTPIAQTLDPVSNLRAHERMTRIASSPRFVVPGHDPAVFVRFPTPGNGVARIR